MNLHASAPGLVTAVHRSDTHTFSKDATPEIELIAGLGVRGDAHCGAQVRHRSRVAADPTQPNLRQVHLLHSELFEDLAARGFGVAPGDMGENITTSGVDLLSLPVGSTLKLGPAALVTITGLRNPCKQIDDFQAGLLGEVLTRSPQGEVVRLAGVMGVVTFGGTVCAGDTIDVAFPPRPHRRLERI